MRVVAGAAIVVWLSVVVYVTVVLPSTSLLEARFSLVPLVDTVRGLLSPSFGNVAVATAANTALFAPLGVALGLISLPEGVATRDWVKPVVFALAVSVAAESFQGFVTERGAVAADDLIANVVGAWLGWLLARRVGPRDVSRVHRGAGTASDDLEGPVVGTSECPEATRGAGEGRRAAG
ncbi:VanZ like family protein [Actinokineospora iranica]|uniref:VanZ like family protein n=1 Tax=Actinokineospora iranica TaxID=1271860 RepID=A0A1G6RAU3_9PSEU|nr:VanZ like family protein [Actinokineospora iranica]